MRSMLSLILFVGSLVLPATTIAQSSAELHVGARVRLVPVGGTAMIGRVTSLPTDSIGFLQSKFGGAPRMFNVAEVSHVQLSAGRNRGRGALKYGLLGLGLGVAAGAIVGAAAYQEGDDFTRSGTAVVGGAFFGSLGLIVGAVTGAARGSERWVEVPVRH